MTAPARPTSAPLRSVPVFRPGSADPRSRRETPLDWQALAACLNTDINLMFPEKGDKNAPAKRVCGHCPVRRECLAYALENDEQHGVWGGLTLRERRRLPRPGVSRTGRRLAA